MKYITLEQFCTCSQTYQRYSDQIDPYPWNSDSVDAIASLMTNIIDPIIDHFGISSFKLTYGFCSIDLKRFLSKGRNQVCCKVDQHMAHEVNRNGNYYCSHLGAACDFQVIGKDSYKIISWIVWDAELPFDSIYCYGKDRPIRISYGLKHRKQGWGFRDDGTPYRLFRLKKPF